MNNGIIKAIVFMLTLILATAAWPAAIYKVVDKEGNVTFTDQPPGDGTQPMDLPELSVIETQVPVQSIPTDAESATVEEAPPKPTARELRRMYRDFRIKQPQAEETFWGTANTVVVSWGSDTPPISGLNVQLIVDGEAQVVASSGSVSLALERGEHTVYAELRDADNKRIRLTPTVTFFIKQHSLNFNRILVPPVGN